MIKYTVIIPTVTIGNKFIAVLDRFINQDYKKKFDLKYININDLILHALKK